MRTREIRLASRPAGQPNESNFEITEVDLPALRPNQLLVRNTYLSVDPYMRPRMDDVDSYIPPFQVGDALDGGAIGEVLESKSEEFSPGDVITHFAGWREHAVIEAEDAMAVDGASVPITTRLGVLGGPGFTGYVGLLQAAALEDGDVVFVSGAAGAVGSLVGQLARVRGHRVVGSAGSDEKVRHLVDELGFSAAFNYKTGDVTKALRDIAPDGIDVYFDNVGGAQLEAAIDVANDFGRIALCGAIGQYNALTPPSAPHNLNRAITKRLTIRGFIVDDYWDTYDEFTAEVEPLVAGGEIKYSETIVQGGLEETPGAFLSLLSGGNTGKMLVQL